MTSTAARIRAYEVLQAAFFAAWEAHHNLPRRVRELEDFGSLFVASDFAQAIRQLPTPSGLRFLSLRSLIEKKKLAALESFKEKSAGAPAAEPEATAASSA